MKKTLALLFVSVLLVLVPCSCDESISRSFDPLFSTVDSVSGTTGKEADLAFSLSMSYGKIVRYSQSESGENTLQLAIDQNLAEPSSLSFTENSVSLKAKDEDSLSSALETLKEIIRTKNVYSACSGSIDLTDNGGLRVMGFNIKSSAEEPNEKTADILSMIGLYHPDLVGIQEMIPAIQTPFEASIRHYRGFGLYRDESHKECCRIYYNTDSLQLLDSETKWLSETPDSPSKVATAKFNRTVVIGVFREKATGTVFVFATTHLDHVCSDEDRVLQAQVLAELLQEKSESYGSCPIIVCGDFNCTPTSNPIKSMQDDGFVDCATTETSTYSNRRIDFIFGKGISDTLHYDVCRNKFDGSYISDHHPIIADIVLGDIAQTVGK